MSLSQEEKFGHLLKPIRELAANWDINIASELEEYLVKAGPLIKGEAGLEIRRVHLSNKWLIVSQQEVLESVTFSVEGSGSVNFAEGEASKPCDFVPWLR